MIYSFGSPAGLGRIINSSKLGFFIEMEDAVDINLFQLLDVEVLYGDERHRPYRHICKVCVIRKTASGVGVEVESSRLEASNVIPFSYPFKLSHAQKIPSALMAAPANHNKQLVH